MRTKLVVEYFSNLIDPWYRASLVDLETGQTVVSFETSNDFFAVGTVIALATQTQAELTIVGREYKDIK